MVSIQQFSPKDSALRTADNSAIQRLSGNETFLINDPQTAWEVESGSLGIFVVSWEKDGPTGPRRYLFTVNTHELLLGCKPRDYGLIAIAFEPTTLRPVPKTCTQANSTISAYQSDKLADWVNHFSEISGFLQPATATTANQAEYISLQAGQIYLTEEKLTWVKIKESDRPSTACWLGRPTAEISPQTGFFPMGKSSWLRANEALELHSFSVGNDSSERVDGTVDPEIFATETFDIETFHLETFHLETFHLETFHQYALDLIEEIITEQTQTDFQQFQQRQQLNQQTATKTIEGLISLIKPKDESYLAAETPLLVAAGAVGHALGIKISPPQSSENLQQVKEPLEAIARASKLRLRQILLRGEWWKQDSGPMLAYTQDDQLPMALLPVKDNRYECFDPVTKTREPITEQIANRFNPRAFVFYRPLPEGKLNAWTLLKFAFHGHGRDIWMVVGTGIVMSLLGMAIPQATAVLIDDAIPYGNRSLLIQIGLVLLAVAFGRSCFQFAQAIAAMRLETSSDITLQAAVWDRLLKLHPSFFRDFSTGDLQARVSSINAIRSRLSGTALDALLSGAFALLNLGLLFYYSSSLAILALFVAILVMGVTLISGVLLLKKQRPLLALDGEIYGLMVQLINGVSKLRMAGAEPRAFAQWGQKYQQQLRLDASTQKLEDAVAVFNTAMPTLTAIGLFGLATTLVNLAGMSGLSSGQFLAFNAAFSIFIIGATSLSQTAIEVLGVIPLWMRSQPILAATPEVDTQKADPGRLAGRICLDHVTFRYREDGPLILDDVTIETHPGEFIALVGPSGSGKSTVLRLLLGFESPQSGTLYYDNQDVCGLDITAVRRQLGVVLQNGRINAGTLFENISGGALITLDDAWKAARMAGFAEDIQSFPMEMHTVISEGGGNLSGGQRQRLMIARALALNPKILLFDEATSALDNRTQAIVSKSLDQLNVTRIVVAHRLSTIRSADRIYVIKSGRVVQQGSFDQLADQKGVFQELIKRQSA
ncbi:MAG: NHLP bacteriocin export ABC transporter permease/ATPase subunit [Cyanobacteria bacterium J06627_28]